MLPTIHPGDTLLVQGTLAVSVETGAMVVVRNGNTWVVHRLIRRKPVGEILRLLTKGDNRLSADLSFETSRPIGVVTSLQRGNSSISLLTWRARIGGRGLALLSWVQAKLYLPAPGLVRKLILRGLHHGIYFLAILVYKL